MQLTSKDGTSIGYDVAGSGPALILVDGALCHRDLGPNRRLGEALRSHFTVITYDRRGRRESGDTAPYAIEREVEDIEALIDAAGGSAHLCGISSGGALALEAAKLLGAKVERVAAYEIPFVVDDSRPPVPEGFADELTRLVAAGRRGAAVKLFMRQAVRVPGPLVAAMPLFPGWAANKRHAHTLLYELAVMGEGSQSGRPVPAGRWKSVTAPVLVASGAKSPAWVGTAAAQLADALPGAEHVTLEGQSHYVKAAAFAPVLTEFLVGQAVRHGARPARPRNLVLGT